MSGTQVSYPATLALPECRATDEGLISSGVVSLGLRGDDTYDLRIFGRIIDLVASTPSSKYIYSKYMPNLADASMRIVENLYLLQPMRVADSTY